MLHERHLIQKQKRRQSRILTTLYNTIHSYSSNEDIQYLHTNRSKIVLWVETHWRSSSSHHLFACIFDYRTYSKTDTGGLRSGHDHKWPIPTKWSRTLWVYIKMVWYRLREYHFTWQNGQPCVLNVSLIIFIHLVTKQSFVWIDLPASYNSVANPICRSNNIFILAVVGYFLL